MLENELICIKTININLMNFETAKQLQKEISDKFLFARKNVAAYAGSDWDDAERTPTELVYDIFADVFGVDIIAHEEGGYLIQLLSEQEDLYLEPVIEYFDRDPKDMVAAVSSPYSSFFADAHWKLAAQSATG
jgi:hypothetical protein